MQKNTNLELHDIHTKMKKLKKLMDEIKTYKTYAASPCKQWREFMQNCSQTKSRRSQKPRARRSRKPEEAKSQKPEAKSQKPKSAKKKTKKKKKKYPAIVKQETKPKLYGVMHYMQVYLHCTSKLLDHHLKWYAENSKTRDIQSSWNPIII